MPVRQTVRLNAAMCLSSLFATAAFAAPGQQGSTDQPVAEQVSEQTPTETGDIVVTARRRSESLQDVPISVTAFDAEQLEARAINSFRELGAVLPNVQYTERGSLSTQLTIRGVGGDARNIGIEAGVGLYVDGVYVPRTSGYNSDLTEIAQVEVLRGPQGTLFGKNTIGGVVNITTRKPTDESTLR